MPIPISTKLTLIRLIISPLLIPLLLMCLLPFNSYMLNGIATAVFMCLALTDYFDGYYARKYSAESLLGSILDPIADKFLLSAVVIALIALHKMFYLWGLIFILRELLIMAVRAMALEYGISIHVSLMGKIKTTAQFAYLAIVIFNVRANDSSMSTLDGLEMILLMLALSTTVVSAYSYCKEFAQKMKERNFVWLD